MKRKKSITIPKRRLVFSLVVLLGLILNSCSAVRTIITSAETKTTENGNVTIQTKTTESYVGKKQGQ